MRKAKRLIALLTVAMFLLSFSGTSAFAATFSDVTGSASDEIYRLNALGIINGYPDGSFKPESNITRAEFAVIAMSAAGMKNMADSMKNTASKFKDVKAGDWYTGWVNLAASMGYIAGYPDGSFKPNANISYAECITILVRLLGYSEKLPGEWPTEYLAKANDLGISDDVTFTASALATRSNIAVLTSQTLDQNLVVWSKDTDEFINKDNDPTLLSDKFDGAVYDEDDYKVTAWSVNSDGQYELDIDGDPLGDSTTTFVLAKNVVVENGTQPSYLTNQLVNFIYNSDDEEITYLDVVSTKIKTDDVDDDGTGLEVNGTTYKFADGYSLAGMGYADEAAGKYNDFYNVYLDGDNKIYFTEKNPGAAPKMVDEVKTNKTVKFFDSGSVDLDQDDVVVLKDGAVAKAEDLKQSDLVYVTEDANGLDAYVDAYSLKNSGKFDAAMDMDNDDATFEQVKIAGKKYDVNASALVSTDNGDSWSEVGDDADLSIFDDIYGKDVKFGLDKKGDVAFILSDVEGSESSIYGIVDEATAVNLKSEATSIKIMKADGSLVDYPVNMAELSLDYTDDADAYSGTGADEQFADRDAVKFTLDSNGKIDTFSVLDMTTNVIEDGSKDLNKLQIDGTWYYTTSDTKVLNAQTGEDDPAIETTSNLLKYADEDLNGLATLDAWVKVDGNKVQYVMFDDNLGVASDDKAMVIDKFYSDGDVWVTVDIRGEVKDLESKNAYSDIDTDMIYDYSLSDNKIDLDTVAGPVDATVDYDVYGLVTDVDEANKNFEVADNDQYELDADSYVYDMTGDDPKYVADITGINEDDAVFVIEVTGDADRKGVADVVLIVDEADLP